ncbi:MAG TPA: N-acetylmuramoyl-L-alanine amidase [Candidatus Sulfotelmatobacter sp.]|jgi:N-acetylmuramoyl-L-alanine amidase/putative methionine-R-sulfoxide reductase with GAF domain
MATTITKPDLEATTSLQGTRASAWTRVENSCEVGSSSSSASDLTKPTQRDALQALLAFSALHDQVRRRKSLAAQSHSFDASTPLAAQRSEFEPEELFVLDEVLQLVAERAVAITGADGLAIALAENKEIVLRAAAGTVRPDVGARIERDSAFSGACFRTAQVVTCDDTETDSRVNLEACRKLGARSMVAVPLCGHRRVIGVLEAFSEWPFAFNESDVRNLSLLAELVLGALKPEDEDRFAESARAAATKLEPAPRPAPKPAAASSTKIETPKYVPTSPAAQPKPITVPTKAAAPAPAAATPVAPAPVAVTIAPTPVPVVPASVLQAKPDVAATPGSAPRAAILDKPAESVPQSASEIATPGPSASAEEPTEPAHRPFMLILLVCIIVGTALAAGVWWKLKTSQLGGAMIRTETMPVKPAPTDAAQPAPSTESAPTKLNDGNAAPESISDENEPERSPASVQELSKFPRITGIRHWSSADSSTVVLDLEDQVQYEAHRITGPDRIYFDLRDTQLAADLVGKSIDVGDTFVSRIRMAQPVMGMTRIVLETKPNSTFSVSLEPNPYRLVVEVRKIGATPKGAVNLFPNADSASKSALAIVVPPPTKEDLQLRARVPKLRIVVDAGHGGWDLGTVGRRGLLEKDLVLEIAQRLGKLLESRLGFEVIYTRQDDTYIPLDERANIANQAQADLFISVHANYSDLPSARGVETYYTNFFSAPGSKEAGPKELGLNSSSPRLSTSAATTTSAKNLLTPTLSPADLHERIEQSRRLAASVQRSLYGTLSVQNPGLRDRGIKEAGFVVLTESAMPGILAEVSFVSSPTDEQKLRSDGYREQIAEALYRGIARYAATSRSVKVASK